MARKEGALVYLEFACGAPKLSLFSTAPKNHHFNKHHGSQRRPLW